MAASDQYKERLSGWLNEQIEKAGSVGRLASQMSSAPDQYISREQLRKWSTQTYVKEIDPRMLSILAAYRGESVTDTRLWLEGRQSTAVIPSVTRRQIEAIDNPKDLIEIQEWITARLKVFIEASTD